MHKILNRIGRPARALLLAAILLPESFIFAPQSANAATAVRRGPHGTTAVHRGAAGSTAVHRGVHGTRYYGHAPYYGATGTAGVARRTSRRVARRHEYYYNN